MWHVVQVQTGNELQTKDICNQLIEKKLLIECFIPLYEKMKRYQGKWHKEKEILFPGYMFIKTDDIDSLFLALKSVPKLTKVLGVGQEFVPIHENEERFLEKILNENYTVEVSKGYIAGEQVYITDGPMKNFRGKIKKINRHKRIAIIELDMFGRKTEASLGLEVIGKYEKEWGVQENNGK